MFCPYCGYPDQKVIESRIARDGDAIRRRRECAQCERRFTTFETYERPRLFVVKRDGSRQEFNREKLFTSLHMACGKRPIPYAEIERVALEIERDLFREFEAEHEVGSKIVGEKAMAALEKLDSVAYIRYASVYLSFEAAEDFKGIVRECEARQRDSKKTGKVMQS